MAKRINLENEYKLYLQTGRIAAIAFSKFSDVQNIKEWQKLCTILSKKEYYQDNKQRIKQKNKDYYYNNKQKVIINQKLYQNQNLDKIKNYQKEYRQQNSQKITKYSYKYYKSNSQIIKVKHKEYFSNKVKTDPIFKFSQNLRTNIRKSFKRVNTAKISKSEIILGISISQFRKYIQEKFKDGMTLQNHGKVWHLDHIIPIAAAKIDCQNQEELQKRIVLLNHYTNFQPLFTEDNLEKHDNIPEGAFLPWHTDSTTIN